MGSLAQGGGGEFSIPLMLSQIFLAPHSILQQVHHLHLGADHHVRHRYTQDVYEGKWEGGDVIGTEGRLPPTIDWYPSLASLVDKCPHA